MEIRYLHLNNFRNYRDLNISFYSGLNLITGENAQGKTNLLEAINYLSLVRSHRAAKDSELIKWKEEFFNIRAKINKNNGDLDLFITYKDRKKNVYINNNKITKFADLLGIVNTIIFTPEDLVLAKGSPFFRRRFLDQFISQIDYKYFYFLQNYHRILKQKNNSLKQNLDQKRQIIEVWNEQLKESGSQLILKRWKVLSRLNEIIGPIHHQISGKREKVEIIYQPSINIKEEEADLNYIKGRYCYFLNKYAKLELERKISFVGPHRDDFIFLIDGMDLKTFGSQGQQRTAVLSLKIAQLELMKELTEEYPLLLMDDVFSELDETRRKNLLLHLKEKVQTFITTSQPIQLGDNLFYKEFIVKQGKILE
ncbi:MAG TPA: DNA replication/repair protein RecF [Clostridia bacterium]|nr:DNA replication/repair protein RecF [Clostridia bacterium]